MRRILFLLTVFILTGTISKAQNNTPPALVQLVMQCQQVIELNDSINARQAKIDELEVRIEELTNSWYKICQEAISSPDCDIDRLIEQTDPQLEADLFAQLKQIKLDKAVSTLKPEPGKTIPSERGNTSRPDERRNTAAPAKEGKDEAEGKTAAKKPAESPEHKAETPRKKGKAPATPVKEEEAQANDSHDSAHGKEDSTAKTKDESNRDKTINTIKTKHKIKNP